MNARVPRRRDEPLPRPRLFEILQHAHALRCVALVAPAGAGKTALLRGWARKERTAHVTVVALAPTEGRLAATMAARCAQLAPSLAGAFSVPPRGREEDALAALAIAIVRHEAALPKPLTFVFDELHAMREPAALQGLQPLLDFCPPRVQCIFASRGQLALSLGRLREHGELLELGAADLKWTLAETQALLRSTLGEGGVDRAQAWHEATEGWSEGLHSMSLAAREGLRDGDLLGSTFEFLEAQVLAPLPPAQRELFAVLSACEVFDARLAAIQGEVPQERCRAMLEQFAAATGFLLHTPDGRWWRFHAVLARHLRSRFDRIHPERKRKFHRRASAFFADCGEQLHAVRQAVQGGDARRAADLVEGWAPALFREGRHDDLAALVRLVPPQAAARSPQLRVWTALLALLEHRYDECGAMLAALGRRVRHDDVATRRRIRVLQGWLAVFRDDMQAAMSVLAPGEGADAVGTIDSITLAAERNVLSWIHIYRNEYERARDVQVEAAATGAPLGTLFGTLSGRCFAGLSLALEGRMDRAERTYRDVLQEAQVCGAACADPAALARGLLGETLYELNDLAGVLALQSTLEQLQRRSLPDPFLRVTLVVLRTHAVLGRPDVAMRHARLLESFAHERRLDRLLSYALLERIRLNLLMQDPDAARPAWDALAALRTAHGAGEGTALGEVAMVADRAEILLLFYRGRLQEARALIDKLLRVSVQRGRRRRVAALHFQRAAIDRESEDEVSARSHTLQGLMLGAQLGLVRSLVDAHPAVPQLLDALELPSANEALAFHADRLRAAAGTGPLVARGLGALRSGEEARWHRAPSLAGLSDREEQVARMLALALPNKEIARGLGLSPETVKWHLHNIYAKLGVGTRYAAVTLLRERSGK